MIHPVRLELTALLLGLPMLAMVRLRRSSDMGSSVAVVPCLLVILALLLAPAAQAGVGDMDPGFGEGGHLAVPEEFSAVSTLPDGRVQMFSISAGQLSTRRFTVDGRPDRTFGTDGLLQVPMPIDPYPGLGAIVLEDGTTWLSAVAEDQNWLVRLDADGRPDAGFGEDGTLALRPFAGIAGTGWTSVRGLAIASSGAFYVLVGHSPGYYDCQDANRLYRFLPDGRPDMQFGPDGAATLPRICPRDDDTDTIVALGERVLYVASTRYTRLLDPHGQPQDVSDAWKDWMGTHTSWELTVSGQYLYAQGELAGGEVAGGASLTRWWQDLTPDRSFGKQGTGGLDIARGDLPVAANSYHQVHFLAPRATDSAIHFRLQSFVLSGQGQVLGGDGVANPGFIGRLTPEGDLDRSFGAGGYVGTAGAPVRLLRGEADRVLLDIQGFGLVRLGADAVDSPGVIVPGLPCDYGTSLRQGDQTSSIQFWRLLGASGPATVNYRTRGRSATPGTDYEESSGTVSWADRDAGIQSVAFRTLDDGSRGNGIRDLELLFDTPAGLPAVTCALALIHIVPAAQPAPVSTNPPAGAPAAPVDQRGGGSLGGCGLGMLLVLHLTRIRRRRDRHASTGG